MNQKHDTSAQESLYEAAILIAEGRRNGAWLPKMRHLALRGHSGATIELADWLSRDNRPESFGRAAERSSPASLYRWAHRMGNPRAAINAAMTCFNRNDLAGYQRWLQLGARRGDSAAKAQLSRFELRLDHKAARAVRRLRPTNRHDR